MKKGNIYIIGAGAIGRALAVMLQGHRSGQDQGDRDNQGQGDHREITLVRASEKVPAHTENIRVRLSDGTTMEGEIAVTSIDAIPVFEGTIIITTKSYANEQIAGRLAGKTGGSPIVILQNGLGVEDAFLRAVISPSLATFKDIYRCVLFATSQHNGSGEISFKPVTASPIGSIRGDQQTLEDLVAAIHTPSFPFTISQDINRITWTKTITNCVFNSICPLLDVDNGIFHRNNDALDLAKKMIAECVEIARLEGISLSEDEVTERLLLISKASDGQLISTLQDIRNKRPTEIDTLNFAIARMAAARGKEVTLTKALGEMIKLKSAI